MIREFSCASILKYAEEDIARVASFAYHKECIMPQAFTTTKAPNETCPQCKAVYAVQVYKAPMKEHDRFVCKCGYVMRDMKSTQTFEYSIIEPGTTTR